MLHDIFTQFQTLSWQAISALVGIAGVLVSIPKMISIMRNRRVETFNNNLKNSEEFQTLKNKVDDYAERTSKAEGDIQTLTVKLDQFIDNNKAWQEAMTHTLRQNTDETREIARYIREMNPPARRSTDKKSKWW